MDAVAAELSLYARYCALRIEKEERLWRSMLETMDDKLWAVPAS